MFFSKRNKKRLKFCSFNNSSKKTYLNSLYTQAFKFDCKMIHPFVNGDINNVVGILKKFDCKIKVSRSEQNQYFSTVLCKYFNQIKLKKVIGTK